VIIMIEKTPKNTEKRVMVEEKTEN
jgi:hypothetical protein